MRDGPPHDLIGCALAVTPDTSRKVCWAETVFVGAAEAVLARWWNTLREAAGRAPAAPFVPDGVAPVDRVVTVVRPRADIPDGVFAAPLLADLALVLAVDHPRHLELMSLDALGDRLRADPNLVRTAIRNLSRITERVVVTGKPGRDVLIVEHAGPCTAALILVPELWDEIAARLGDEPVVCVHARHRLLVAGLRQLDRLADLVLLPDDDPEGPMERGLWVRRGGGWQPLER